MLQGTFFRGLTGFEFFSRQSVFANVQSVLKRSYVRCFWYENNGIKGVPGYCLLFLFRNDLKALLIKKLSCFQERNTQDFFARASSCRLKFTRRDRAM